MVYIRPISTHFLFIKKIEGHIAAISFGNYDEIGSITCRRWCRYGEGTLTVGCAENSIIKNNEGKGKVRTCLVYNM
jgi:hypothetical protein